MAGRLSPWVVAPALSLPLVVLTAWVARGVVPGLRGTPAANTPSTVSQAEPSPRPALDLAADRLEERVDGAADALRADGCRRLLYWRFESPPADAEALVFASVDQARAVLAREAGAERTRGPGDESQVQPQTVSFRRGVVYVRLFLDPGAPPSPELERRAGEIDRVLVRGGWR